MKGLKIIIAGLAMQLVFPSVVWAHGAAFEAGQRFYRQGNLAAAERSFARAVTTERNDAEVHYWYATTLAKRLKGTQAIREYNLALRLHPSQIIAQYSRMALTAYGAYNSLGSLPPSAPTITSESLQIEQIEGPPTQLTEIQNAQQFRSYDGWEDLRDQKWENFLGREHSFGGGRPRS